MRKAGDAGIVRKESRQAVQDSAIDACGVAHGAIAVLEVKLKVFSDNFVDKYGQLVVIESLTRMNDTKKFLADSPIIVEIARYDTQKVANMGSAIEYN